MRIDILTHLAKQLEDLQLRIDALPIDDEKSPFKIDMWANTLTIHAGRDETMDCGFAGCAIGWAAHERWFEKFGWSISLMPGNRMTDTYPVFHRRGEGPVERRCGHRTDAAFEDASSMLEISKRVATRLFSPGYYPGKGEETEPRDVARRVRKLIEVGEKDFLENELYD